MSKVALLTTSTGHSLIGFLCVAAAAADDVGDVQVVDPVDDVAGEEAQREHLPARLVHKLGRVAPPPRVAAA